MAELFKDSKCKSNKYCGKTQYKSPEIVNKNKIFDAKKNDIWCAGVSLYMLLLGIPPWRVAHKSDNCYSFVMAGYSFVNRMKQLLEKWGMLKYVDDDIINLFKCILQSESQRCTLSEIKNHNFMRAE